MFLCSSHPDQDHCGGLRKHFWLGRPEDYPDDDVKRSEKRIIIRELWSSPLIFRRRSKSHTLCEDAQAFNTEARRRENTGGNMVMHLAVIESLSWVKILMAKQMI